MKEKQFIWTIGLAVVIALFLLVVATGWYKHSQTPSPSVQDNQQEESTIPQADIRVSQPQPNEAVALPLVIKGEARGTWYFEADFPVEIRSASGDVLATKPAQAQSDWMTTDFVPFEVTFDSLDWGTATSGEIILKKDNPSGLPENAAEIHIPIQFPAQEMMTVKAFFSNKQNDPAMLHCGTVYPVTRAVPKTVAVAKTAMAELLKGPTGDEQTDGFFTSIPASAQLVSITIQNGIAHATFSPELDRGIGGSCLVTAISEQIRETLLQFSTVNSVVISVQGKPDDEVLQP